jgi:gamma-glutamylcyclotransferase
MSQILYFAYGSNLHLARFRQRVPSANVITSALLPGYELAFCKHGRDDSGKCTILPAANDQVQGVVYEIALSERPDLDELEGGYDRHILVVNTSMGTLQTFTYIARAELIKPGLLPYHWYKDYVLQGAQQHGLDADYCARIKAQNSIDDPDMERARQHLENLTGQ